MQTCWKSAFFLLLGFLLFHTSIQSQVLARDVVCAGGNVASTPQISLIYTLGEAFGGFQSNDPASRYLSVGFNQPDFEIKDIFNKDISKSITVYPNPTNNGQVKVGLSNVPAGDYVVDVIDVPGRILFTTRFNVASLGSLYVPMNVSFLANGTYFLRIRSSLVCCSHVLYSGQVKLLRIRN
jgi:hypothetical protein